MTCHNDFFVMTCHNDFFAMTCCNHFFAMTCHNDYVIMKKYKMTVTDKYPRAAWPRLQSISYVALGEQSWTKINENILKYTKSI